MLNWFNQNGTKVHCCRLEETNATLGLTLEMSDRHCSVYSHLFLFLILFSHLTPQFKLEHPWHTSKTPGTGGLKDHQKFHLSYAGASNPLPLHPPATPLSLHQRARCLKFSPSLSTIQITNRRNVKECNCAAQRMPLHWELRPRRG